MSYPIPKFREQVDVGKLVRGENRGSPQGKHQEMFTQAATALYTYLRSNTFYFHGSSEGLEGTYKKASALTPEGIVIHLSGNYTAGINRVPLDMYFELISFQSPVESLKKELIENFNDFYYLHFSTYILLLSLSRYSCCKYIASH